MTRPIDSLAKRARTRLLGMLNAEHPSERLAAVYGLTWHMPDQGVRRALRRIEQADDDNEIRTVAALVIQGDGHDEANEART